MQQHIPLLSTAMLIHGALLCALGGLVVLSSPIAYLDGEELGVLIFGTLYGIVIALVGSFQLVAGMRLRQYKGRMLGAFASLAGIISCPFCLALNLVLITFACIVLFNKDAIAAFDNGGPLEAG